MSNIIHDSTAVKKIKSTVFENVSYPEQMHYEMEFVFVLEGELIVTREDEEYTLNKGEGLLFMPYEIHSYKTETSSKEAIIVFSSEFIEEVNVGDRFTSYKFPINPLIISYAVELIEKGNLSSAEIKALLYPLFYEFSKTNKPLSKEKEYSELTRLALSYIEEHFNEDISLTAAAEHLHCHYVYLSRCFSHNTGYSFTDYLNRYRITRSLYLLKNTHYSITDIAYKCGFGSLRSFNRVFKSCMNKSPKEYRNSNSELC